MTEECTSYPKYLINDPLFNKIIDRESQRCDIDFHGLLSQGKVGFQELNKKMALYLQPSDEVGTCPNDFVLSAPFPTSTLKGAVVYALEPNKAAQFSHARGDEIKHLIIEHIEDLQALLDIIERKNDEPQWQQDLATCVQKTGIVSVGLEGAEALNEDDLIPEPAGLTEAEIKLRKIMRTLGLFGKTTPVGFIVKQLIFELVKHVFLTQYGQHYLLLNMTDDHLIYESSKMFQGELSVFFKHSMAIDDPQAVLPAPLKGDDGEVIGVYVGHIASRSTGYFWDMLIPFSTEGVIKFYPSASFPTGNYLGWDVAKLPNIMMESQVLASATFAGDLDRFAELIGMAGQSCKSISAVGGVVTANIAANTSQNDSVISYGIVCFSQNPL
ncbi:hypothetical protein [Candidatus Albibeggiatoa sp. nov. BB20]|uniref:hypothetical protein n=1 Tax=Candidatus Albibeggiatoa sp. nov. BB20 TaxID=3162723 RepID=UPI0033655D5E